jgi:hypothetical protein
MTREPATKRVQNGQRTITLPISQGEYEKIIGDHAAFRRLWLDPNFAEHPELFPPDFENGYEMCGRYHAKRLGIDIRRIRLRDGSKYQIRPAFALPMMVGWVEDVAAALFLRKFGVPYWAIVYVFGKNVSYWYRLETSFARNSIVGTTVKIMEIPTNLLADEHHEKLGGEKTYIATTAAGGCVFGAEVSVSASGDDLQKAYGVFKNEALAVEPNYTPETVNTDGWHATQVAWQTLFTTITLIRCFLHAWLKIRDRSKNLKEQFFEIGERVWNVYYSENRAVMGQRIRRLRDWASKHLKGVVLEKVLDLCGKSKLWGVWYDHPDAHATSNMLDRLMRNQNRYFNRGQHFHGNLSSANRRSRSWAILHNYWPWCPESVADNDGATCPAERLNGKRYSDNWRENLLVATSIGGTKKLPHKIRND